MRTEKNSFLYKAVKTITIGCCFSSMESGFPEGDRKKEEEEEERWWSKDSMVSLKT